MEEKFSPLIDARNADLWNELTDNHIIELEESEEPGYLSQFNDDRISIQVDMDNLNPASLTHELLHIYVKDLDVLIAQDIKATVEKFPELRPLFSDSLKEHLGNCLEHSKMLPLYLSRGFRNRDFVRDYDERVMDEEEVLELSREYYHDEAVNRKAFDTYVGKFFALKTSNNRHYDYEDIYEGLKKLDPSLYEVLERFWEAWQTYEVTDPRKKYQQMLDELAAGLLEWKKENIIIEKSPDKE